MTVPDRLATLLHSSSGHRNPPDVRDFIANSIVNNSVLKESGARTVFLNGRNCAVLRLRESKAVFYLYAAYIIEIALSYSFADIDRQAMCRLFNLRVSPCRYIAQNGRIIAEKVLPLCVKLSLTDWRQKTKLGPRNFL